MLLSRPNDNGAWTAWYIFITAAARTGRRGSVGASRTRRSVLAVASRIRRRWGLGTSGIRCRRGLGASGIGLGGPGGTSRIWLRDCSRSRTAISRRCGGTRISQVSIFKQRFS